MEALYALLVVAVIAIIVAICNTHIVPQAHAYVVTRLGAYYKTWGTGIHGTGSRLPAAVGYYQG